MAVLTLSLITSIFKPHKPHLSFLFTTKPTPIFLHHPIRRRFTSNAVSALTTSVQHSSTDPNPNPLKKPSVPTFQQAIQRLQVWIDRAAWGGIFKGVLGICWMRHNAMQQHRGWSWDNESPDIFKGSRSRTMECCSRWMIAPFWTFGLFEGKGADALLKIADIVASGGRYVEPSIRPDDSRYGENPNRLQRHTQFQFCFNPSQVILKPDPGNSQDLFIRSLSALGIDVNEHDIRFVEDNWESPVLGAWGLGWEIWLDGMEITQFTYFQQAGSLQLMPISVEITYGLERILMLLQGVDHFKKIQYADGITYGELFSENEKEMSAYYLEHANVDHIQKHFNLSEAEARSLLDLGLAIPAYDQLLKTSHAFNILDARGFVGVTERARYFGRMRSLARQCALLWSKTRESLRHPLGVLSEPNDLVSKEILEVALDKVPVEPRSFVLEIGTEELPPDDVASASQQLKSLVVQLLETKRISHGEVLAFGTPRRLVYVESLSSKQVEIESEVRGPPVSKAFDNQGYPTKAAEGFCRRYSVPLNSVYRRTEGKTEYVFARVVESARLAFQVLSEELPGSIAKISFQKSMRWNSEVMFSRPVRWILALHGDLVVPLIFAGVLRQIESAESYVDVIRHAGISIDIEQRKKTILERSSSLAEGVDGSIVIQSGLLDEVVNLVEAPVPVLGKFEESFLMLPKDLLIMVMQKHQKYFAMTDTNGQLLPYFISVANGTINEAVVKKGNEAVLRARYEDAKFFYKLDTSKKFSEFRNGLKGILFHEKLGTMLDKMIRLESIVAEIGLALGVGEDKLQTIRDAASLAMSDLATAVVTEFTSLSGIMARHYALRDGYSEQISEALFEITLPRFSGDVLPKTDAGTVLSIADRLDSLVGLFGAGCQPSSSSDPFGLRRISYGLVQVLVDNKRNLDVRYAIGLAAAVQPIKVDARTIDDVHQFVTRRLEQFLVCVTFLPTNSLSISLKFSPVITLPNYLSSSRVDKGISPEVVRSILTERANMPYLAAKSAYKLEALSKGELLPKVVEAYSRPTRIVRGKDINNNIEVLFLKKTLTILL
ncbi:hypothetical protein RJ640_007344 [Escallonia rubra]|uniref:glycine--tRNA ligase n=1 Tax=Escallonia rubra TaxID=112253 RepID=A0AA88R507_9ASTE|nr:hypothetical protein RJ640_007344 [Escallonia rubra]